MATTALEMKEEEKKRVENPYDNLPIKKEKTDDVTGDKENSENESKSKLCQLEDSLAGNCKKILLPVSNLFLRKKYITHSFESKLVFL